MARELFKLVGLIGMRGVEKTTKQLTAIEKQVKKVRVVMFQAGAKAEKLGKQLAKGITLPILAVGAIALKVGATFEKAMTKSLAIMGDVSNEMRKSMEDTAKSVSNVTTFSAKQAADAYFFLASAGLNAAQSLKALPITAKFAQAGNFGLAIATDLLTDAQSALGLVVKDTAKNMENMVSVSDVLVKANTIANATVQQFSEALTNKAGAALRIVGKSIEEGTAVLAAFADQGVKGADAGTQLNIVMRDLQKSAINNKQAFKDAKVEVFDSAGEMRNMADIIKDLEDMLVGMSDEQKRSAFTMLGFQEKSISATLSLVGLSDKIRGYQTELEKAGGITDEVANKSVKNLIDQLTILKNRVVNALTTLFGEFSGTLNGTVIPALGKVIGKVESAVKWFTKLSPEMKKTIGQWLLLAAALGPVLIAVGQFVKWARILIPLYKALMLGQVSWNAVMAANPIGITVVAIAALVAAGIFLANNWDMVSKFIKESWDTVVFAFEQSVSFLKGLFFKVLSAFLEMHEGIASVIPPLKKGVEALRAKLKEMESQEKLGRIERKKNRIETKLAAKATEEYSKTIEEAKDNVKELTDAEGKNVKAKKILTAEEKKIIADRKKLQDDWNLKLEKSLTDELGRLAIERRESIAQAEKLGADTTAIKEFFANEEKNIRDKTQEERVDLENQWFERLIGAQEDKLAILALEKDEAIRIAEEKGAGIFEIEAFFELEMLKVKEENAKKEVKLAQRVAKSKMKAANEALNFISQTLGQIDVIAGQFGQNELDRIDIQKQKDIERINNSTLLEEEKANAIAAIEEDADKKSRDIKRNQAKQDKVFSIFQIGINTAMGMMKVISQFGAPVGFVLSALVAAMGIAQTIAVASKPLPLAKGGFVKNKPGRGIVAQIGEGLDDEIVMPLSKGMEAFFEMFMDRIKTIGSNIIAPEPVPTLATATSGNKINLNIGTLIADKRGLTELERRLEVIRFSEDKRRGVQ